MKRRVISTFLATVMTACMIMLSICPASAEDLPWSDLLLDAGKWNYNSWDITAESEQKIHVVSDIADEEYSLLTRPESDSALVKSQEKQVKQTISLDVLLSSCDNCVELLNIVKNVTNGIGMSSAGTRLMNKFGGTNDTMMVVMSGLKSAADITVSDLIQAYKYATDAKYLNQQTDRRLVEKVLTKIEVRSESNASQVKNLINEFDAEEEIAVDMLKKIMNDYDVDSDKRNEINASMDDIVKKIDYLKEQKETLYDKVNEYSKRYTDFSYELPGREMTVIKAAGISSIYGGIASTFGLPQADVALISEQQENIQTAYTEVIEKLISLVTKVANSSESDRNADLAANSLIAMRSSLRLIGVYLGDLNTFWENVAASSQNMIARYNAIQEAYKQPENAGHNYIEFFKDKEFTEAYLVCLANWSALRNMSSDFLNEFYQIRLNCSKYLRETEVAPHVHLEQARRFATALSAKMKEQVSQSTYSGTVINKMPSIVLIAIILSVVAIAVAALVIAKKRSKKNS